MTIPWQSSAAAFERILERHGSGGDMESAWAAFREFVQTPVDGVEPAEDDGDGFIVEWGTWSWNERRPAISLGRQLAVTGGGDRDDPRWQPEYWKVELQVSFADDPAWAGLGALAYQDTGFDFAEIGPARLAALAEARAVVESLPQLRAMWRAEPVESCVTLDRAG